MMVNHEMGNLCYINIFGDKHSHKNVHNFIQKIYKMHSLHTPRHVNIVI